MENNWKEIIKGLTPTCQEVLGRHENHQKDWTSVETLDNIQERKIKKTAINNSRKRTEKVKVQAECTEANKQVKKSIRVNKQKYLKDLSTTVEKATREDSMRELCDATKKLAEKYCKPERLVKDKEGKPFNEIQEQRKRLVEHF
ncbi:unnamed protein product [Schistosoma curassoni]|uniref:Uncharacterized protein n=1 Tax=Schistosoma curassoni TaxID=6186 RepID=A0A183KFC7_9TREM|nr:unnamed protein product [Schistosoma curassoni]